MSTIFVTSEGKFKLQPLQQWDDFIMANNIKSEITVNGILPAPHGSGWVIDRNKKYVCSQIQTYSNGWLLYGADLYVLNAVTDKYDLESTKYVIAINRENYFARDPHVPRDFYEGI